MEKKDLRIIFMGTPDFAVETLKRLIDGDYNVVAVVTQPDRPVGRHQDHLQPSAVKEYAMEHGLPVMQPEKMKDEDFLKELQSYHADLQVVVAFRMLPEVVWNMPRFGTFNVHAALLPLYRGAAPINWAIINGEKETGVTTFFLDHDIDTGLVIMQKRFPIPEDADAEYVHDGLMLLGAEAAIETVDRIIDADGKIHAVSQETLMTEDMMKQMPTAPKIFNDTCLIRWNKSANMIHNFVRGLSPYPGAWTMFHAVSDHQAKALKFKVFKTCVTELTSQSSVGDVIIDKGHMYVATSDFLLELLEVQIAGKKRMPASSFINGLREGSYRLGE